jgi:prophage regulatory protein
MSQNLSGLPNEHQKRALRDDLLGSCRAQRSTSAIDALPPNLARNRILGSADAAAFWGVSLPHWRRLYRVQQVPTPIKLSARKLGWRVGDLIDALETRSAA